MPPYPIWPRSGLGANIGPGGQEHILTGADTRQPSLNPLQTTAMARTSDDDPGYAALPLALRRRIDAAFDSALLSTRSSSPHPKRRKLSRDQASAPGGFLLDDPAPGGFLLDGSPPSGGFLPDEPTQSNDEDDEDGDDAEWQQVPEEWLQESATPSRRTRTQTRSRMPRPPPPQDSDEEVENERAEETGEEGADSEEGDGDDGENPEDHELLQKAGLESGSASDLTDLSDKEDDDDDEGVAVAPRAARRSRRRAGGGGGGRRKSARQNQRAKSNRKAPAKDPEPAPEPKPEEDVEEDQEMDVEPPVPAAPADFVEWEAVRSVPNLMMAIGHVSHARTLC